MRDDGAPFECCVCGPTQREPFLSQVPDRLGVSSKTFDYVRCGSCGLISLFPRPSFEETAAFSPTMFWRTAQAPDSAESLSQRVETWLRDRLVAADFARVRSLFRPGLRHLDVGCATGDFISLCRSCGTEPSGIELSESAVRYCREARGLDVVQGDLVDHDFAGRTFELITYNGVIENVPDPRAHLCKARSLLAPGGSLLLLGVPNIDSAGFRLAGKGWIGLDTPRHIHQFSRHSLKTLLDRAGFRIERLDTRSPRFNRTSLVASTFPSLHRHAFDAHQARTGRNPLLRKAALAGLLQLVRPLDAVLSRFGLGEHITIVARAT